MLIHAPTLIATKWLQFDFHLDSRDTHPPVQIIFCSGLTLFVETKILLVCGRLVPLSKRETVIMRVLMESPGIVISRDTFLDALCDKETEFFDRIIDTYIRRIRRKMFPTLPQFSCVIIQGMYSLGYRLNVGPVLSKPEQLLSQQTRKTALQKELVTYNKSLRKT
ncbi:MAG: winged helix-turn-helix domain-containing protein [Patescibacteria group bacterium]